MKKVQLFWIVPLALMLGTILGTMFGFLLGVGFVASAETIMDSACELAIDTLDYVTYTNETCMDLASGFMIDNQDNYFVFDVIEEME